MTCRPTSPSSSQSGRTLRPASSPTTSRRAFELLASTMSSRSSSPGRGSVNFHLRPSYYHEALESIVAAGEANYARPDLGHGERVQIEFVSANPTGPLHVGNGWFGAYGDALARLLDRCGFQVEREYYLNDTGNQIKLLGESLLARRAGDAPPEEGYQGEDLVELRRRTTVPTNRWPRGSSHPTGSSRTSSRPSRGSGSASIAGTAKPRSRSLGLVDGTIALLRARDAVYDADGATWFRSSAFGDSRDRALIRSDGQPTYLAGDLAYHRDKFVTRGVGRVIDVWGADHHGQVASLARWHRRVGCRSRTPRGHFGSSHLARERKDVEASRKFCSPRRTHRHGWTGRSAAVDADELDQPIDDDRSGRAQRC